MLKEYAENELKRAGLFDKDSDYNGQLANATVELIEVFEKQGHSGASGAMTLGLFEKLARFQPLTPLTSNPEEWTDISEASGEPMWQSKRNPSVFSNDGGKTWYDLDGKDNLERHNEI